jgi:hypothetical protein
VLTGNVIFQAKAEIPADDPKPDLYQVWVQMTPVGVWPGSNTAARQVEDLIPLKNNYALKSFNLAAAKWELQAELRHPNKPVKEKERVNFEVKGQDRFEGRVHIETPKQFQTFTLPGSAVFQARVNVPSYDPDPRSWEVEVVIQPQTPGLVIRERVRVVNNYCLKLFKLGQGKYKLQARVVKPREGEWTSWHDFEVKGAASAPPAPPAPAGPKGFR